ncbi:MAG: hypothetical protein A2638_01235 [Nitrospirae bacterium RIFCSPHIGHO2_01_FULL_66_17]|nr:MAG: hypothetical protein A2638_01235 [Nitrospirae bacterium RIFCSPHIGHO2_01_FULL_66_17]
MDEETIRPDMAHPYLSGADPRVPALNVLSGPLEGREYRLTNELYVIGRDPESDIVIDQREVSRRHAKIMRMASEYLLADLSSANGVYVNNLKLDRHVLAHGDVFQIGSCVFQFVWDRGEAASR